MIHTRAVLSAQIRMMKTSNMKITKNQGLLEEQNERAIWKRCFLKTLFSSVDGENNAIWRWRYQPGARPPWHSRPQTLRFLSGGWGRGVNCMVVFQPILILTSNFTPIHVYPCLGAGGVLHRVLYGEAPHLGPIVHHSTWERGCIPPLWLKGYPFPGANSTRSHTNLSRYCWKAWCIVGLQ